MKLTKQDSATNAKTATRKASNSTNYGYSMATAPSVDLTGVWTAINANINNIKNNEREIESLKNKVGQTDGKYLRKDTNDNNGDNSLTLGSLYTDVIATTDYAHDNGVLVGKYGNDEKGIWLKGFASITSRTLNYSGKTGTAITFDRSSINEVVDVKDSKGFTLTNYNKGITATVQAGLTATNGVGVIEEHLYYLPVKSQSGVTADEINDDDVATQALDAGGIVIDVDNDIQPATPYDDYAEASKTTNDNWVIYLRDDGEYNYQLWYVATISVTYTNVMQSATPYIKPVVKYFRGAKTTANITPDKVELTKDNVGMRLTADGLYRLSGSTVTKIV